MEANRYLDKLARVLSTGVARLPAKSRARHGRYIVSTQNPDGGVSGRQGASDLYYTNFALRCAELLGEENPVFWRRAAEYLRRRGPAAADVVECLSLLHAERLVARHGGVAQLEREHRLTACDVKDVLARHHGPQGGYAKSKAAGPSVYHTFLAALCYDLVGRELPRARKAAAFVRSQQCADGGFADASDAGEHGGTNPTAAAVGFLAMLGILDDGTGRRAAEFIASMQRADRGFAAHGHAPMSDLMSTFTALVTLSDVGGMARVKLAPVARFAQSLALPTGGFRAMAMDDAADVEYTYYGLGALGLLALQTTRGKT